MLRYVIGCRLFLSWGAYRVKSKRERSTQGQPASTDWRAAAHSLKGSFV